ncbi:cytochrome b/b6 domain-containing protein [Tabrizicola sp. J26]|uniref:cytochrome b n=1 Tax=Alitabrizicola rongguiensis TaxID=2909234 RepID=UPI001F389E21|nr:cytochrome b/b6 domain-containing protein [Tabrizicola rongguiensis]MCF1710279.1 cytochrome b/b6 domain-containing protein [Tabrizicola rongguiensis]
MSQTAVAYRPAQIWLHWSVVIGVIVQIGFHDPIVAVVDAREAGQAPTASDVSLAWVHVGVGSLILLAVLARLYLRWRHGTPGHAPGTSVLQARSATLMHAVLYGLLLAMVVTGMLTWTGIAPLGGLHFAINVALFFSALVHAAAAIFNQVVRKDGTLARMVPLLRR